MNIDVIAARRTCSCALINEDCATMLACPRQNCCFTIVSFNSAAKLGLISSERHDFFDASEFNNLNPWQVYRSGKGWIRRDTADYFLHHFSRHDSPETGR